MKKHFVAAGVVLSLAAPVWAIFGIGDLVFDPTSCEQLISQLTQLEQQYSQLVKTYTMVTNQYNQLVTDAKMISSKSRWKTFLSPWTFPAATNTYGTTSGWIASLNSGLSSFAGYHSAVSQVLDYGTVWSALNSVQKDKLGRNYASVELSDGVGVNALQQLGTIRGNSAQVQAAIDSLEADSLSDSDALNTTVGVLNKVNAASIIAVRNSQDSNKLLASLLDHQMVAAKSQRDAQAQSINNDVALRQGAPQIDEQHLTGATSVLTTYRIP